jgi:hypothetical protein
MASNANTTRTQTPERDTRESQAETAPDASNTAQGSDETTLSVEKIPWSRLAQEFAESWGRADPKDPQPEHMEVFGINGSGKSLFVCKVIQERMVVRHTPCVMLQSKPADETVLRLGWPVITDGDVRKVKKERWSIFWPQTNATGMARKNYQAIQFRNLLDSLWQKDANTIVVFDDFGYIQELVAPDTREPLAPIVQMYLREGRSAGITNVLVKQRPQGSRREMHSETPWTVGFAPKDEDDAERFAQIFGNRKEYKEVFKQMDPDKHEFLIKHYRTNSVYISWIDTPLRPIQRPKRNVKPRP